MLEETAQASAKLLPVQPLLWIGKLVATSKLRAAQHVAGAIVGEDDSGRRTGGCRDRRQPRFAAVAVLIVSLCRGAAV